MLKTLIKLLLGKGSMRSYSQFGEDAAIVALTRNLATGVYVDVGAYHPTLYSNTYALYRKGWSGVVLDPNAAMKPLYRVFRSRDTFLSVAIAKTPGTAKYFSYADGAYNTLSTDRVAALKQERGMEPDSVRDIRVAPLADILKEQGITHIDLLSIDVEGLDREVLESHDWTIPPHVIAVEDHGFDPRMPEESGIARYLVEKGYVLTGFTGPTLLFKHS